MEPGYKKVIKKSFFSLKSSSNQLRRILTKMSNLVIELLNSMVYEEKFKQYYDFSLLNAYNKRLSIKMMNEHPLYILAETEDKDIMSHQVLRELTKIRWGSLPRKTFALNFMFFFLFVCLLTIKLALSKIRPENDTTISHHNYTYVEAAFNLTLNSTRLNDTVCNPHLYINIFIAMFLFIHSFKELIQMLIARLRYIDGLDNLFELATFILSWIFLSSELKFRVLKTPQETSNSWFVYK